MFMLCYCVKCVVVSGEGEIRCNQTLLFVIPYNVWYMFVIVSDIFLFAWPFQYPRFKRGWEKQNREDKMMEEIMEELDCFGELILHLS